MKTSLLTDAQVIPEWKRRRSITWRSIRFPLVILIVSGIAFWYEMRTPASEMTGTQLLASFLIFGVLGVSMIVVIVRVSRLYRCPRCDSVVMDSESGIPLNPKRCGKCQAVLRDFL